MAFLLTILAGLAFAAGPALGSILTVDSDHSYQRLSVRVTDQVPRQLCQVTLDHLEELLTSTSKSLYKTTKRKARFDTINVLLPSSWSGSDCLNGRPINDKLSLPENADFVISSPHPLFGAERPISIQYGQCGQSGLHGVQIPHGLISSANLTEATKISTFREWVHYRYGTFSEVGFDSDSLYPSQYQFGPLEKQSQGCGNLTWSNAGEDFEQMVDASIDLKAMCDATTDHYDRDSPTKQNLLCNRQSTLEAMLDHPDFKRFTTTEEDQILKQKIRNVDSFQIELVIAADNSEDAQDAVRQDLQGAPFKAPSFSYILPSKRRHILVLDISQNMDVDRQWEMARNSLFRFIAHVPEGDEVGIVSFGAKARINIEPTEVTASNREGLYGRVPFRLAEGQQGCLECGLRLATKLMDTPRSVSNGAITLLTASKGQESTVLEEVADYVEEKALPVYIVAFEADLQLEVAQLAKYGANFVVEKGFVLQTLGNAFMEILNKGRDLNQRLEKCYERKFPLDNHRHEATSSNGKRGTAISGNFVVEDNLRSNLWVILTSPFKEDVEIFEITSPSGQRKVFPKFENGLVYFYLDGLSEAGIWSYRATLFPVALKSSEVTVEVIAQPTSNKDDTIKVESWTNVAFAQPSEKDGLVIYAKVSKGQDLPIMNAQVVATVLRPDSSVAFEVVLKDNGLGYPDITSGDGIYSGYFTGFTTKTGLYGIDIKVTDNEGRASTPTLLSNGRHQVECCGSALINPGLFYTTPMAQYSRYLKAAAFYVTKGVEYFVVNGQPEMDDVFPPSRVPDLAVMAFVNNTLYATLRWSAPGGDYDLGKAETYEIRCYTNAEALSNTNFANMGIPVHDSLLPKPAMQGQEQTATVGLPWANEIFYYGLVAVDAAGNRSPVSNLVPVFASEVSPTDSLENDFSGGEEDRNIFSSAIQEAFGSNDVLIYIVAGVISGLVLIISIIVIYTVCRAKAKKAEEKRKQNARTQIFVNDLESQNCTVLPDLAPEKPQNYSEVWATHTSGLPSNNSPTNSSLEEYANMMMYNSTRPPVHVPVHEYRSSSIPIQPQYVAAEEVTYQNWTNNHKPPSDNGTATTSTSSTECYEDNSDKNGNIRVAPLIQRRYSVEDYLSTNLSLSPSFCSSSEKRRRQESLV